MRFKLDEDEDPQMVLIAVWGSLKENRGERLANYAKQGKATYQGRTMLQGLEKRQSDFGIPTLVRCTDSCVRSDKWLVTQEVFEALDKMETDAGYTRQWWNMEHSGLSYNGDTDDKTGTKCVVWVRFHMDPVSRLIHGALRM